MDAIPVLVVLGKRTRPECLICLLALAKFVSLGHLHTNVRKVRRVLRPYDTETQFGSVRIIDATMLRCYDTTATTKAPNDQYPNIPIS
ncbi:hypothetical protein F5B19DRAFT_437487 [Rostrohypoxylon terebratum]|nr:hypothetical protein F5B19DRAFT_437487 [Rostrohypoxylon terebratum]